MREPGVRVEGIDELRRGLRAIQTDLQPELDRSMEGAASRTVLPRARAFTPRQTGESAQSLTVVAQSRGTVAIRSRLPWMNVLHWGGTTGKGHRPGVPGSGSVKVKGSRFVERAGEERMEAFAQELGDTIDQFLGHHGLR
jgi:hypothetical protein